MKRPTCFSLIAAVIASAMASAAAKEIQIEVAAGDCDRMATPVFFQLPDTLAQAETLSLICQDDGSAVAVQRLPDEAGRIAWIVRDLPRGQSRRYRLTTAKQADSISHFPKVTCTDDGRRLLVKVGDKEVLQYNAAMVESPEGIEGFYRRSGYIHPVFDPDGRVVTDDFAPDHAHQHGVFFAWVNTTFQGRPVDFWNQKKGQGAISHVETDSIAGGPVFAQFSTHLQHVDNTSPEGSVPVLQETWTVRVYNCSDVFLFDLESRQQCVADDPLIINQYHYGGMALRAAREWFDPTGGNLKDDDPQTGTGAGFLTSEGKLRADGNHTRPDWVSTYGPIDGRYSTITIMSHPENFRHPQPVRLHPAKPYFCFAPMVLGEFSLKPGQPYVSRYRYCTAAGRPSPEQNRRVWSDYSKPPVIRVLPPAAPQR